MTSSKIDVKKRKTAPPSEASVSALVKSLVLMLLTLSAVAGEVVFGDTCKFPNYTYDTKDTLSVCQKEKSSNTGDDGTSCVNEISIKTFYLFLATGDEEQCPPPPRSNENRPVPFYTAHCFMMDEYYRRFAKDIAAALMGCRRDGKGLSISCQEDQALNRLLPKNVGILVKYECRPTSNYIINSCVNTSIVNTSPVHLMLNTTSLTAEPASCNCRVKTLRPVTVHAIDVRLEKALLEMDGGGKYKVFDGSEILWNEDGQLFRSTQDFHFSLTTEFGLPKKLWLVFEGDSFNISCVTKVFENYDGRKYNSVVALIFVILAMFNFVPLLFYVIITKYKIAVKARDMVKRMSYIRQNSDIVRKNQSVDSYLVPQSALYDEMIFNLSEQNEYMLSMI